jgi:integrase
MEWSSRYDHLREVTREDIFAARDAVTGKQRESRIVALRSLFRHAKKNGQIFRNPTIRIRVPRQTGGVLQALVQADIDEAIATATTPDLRLIVALAAVHAARPKMIRTMQLDDVDLGNRRITVGSHVRPLDDLTHRAVLDWLDHRRNRWPNTANPHLLITQKTAVELGPAGKLWTTRATRNLTATLERLRVDRQLEEALTHGADPLHLALVFGIDEKTAIRYAESARVLLDEAAEQPSQ